MPLVPSTPTTVVVIQIVISTRISRDPDEVAVRTNHVRGREPKAVKGLRNCLLTSGHFVAFQSLLHFTVPPLLVACPHGRRPSELTETCFLLYRHPAGLDASGSSLKLEAGTPKCGIQAHMGAKESGQ